MNDSQQFLLIYLEVLEFKFFKEGNCLNRIAVFGKPGGGNKQNDTQTVFCFYQ